MKKLVTYLLFITCFILSSCEDLFETEEEAQEPIEVVETEISVKQYFYTSDNFGSIEYIPQTFTWDSNSIVLNDIEPNNFVQSIRINNLNVSGLSFIEFNENSSIVGEFVTLENGTSHLYKTNIEVTFWENPEQGGYINITDFNSANQTISGEIQFTAWRWDSQLNREVSFGFNIQFDNLIKS